MAACRNEWRSHGAAAPFFRFLSILYLTGVRILRAASDTMFSATGGAICVSASIGPAQWQLPCFALRQFVSWLQQFAPTARRRSLDQGPHHSVWPLFSVAHGQAAGE